MISSLLIAVVQFAAFAIGASAVVLAVFGYNAGNFEAAVVNIGSAIACGLVFLFMEYLRATLVR